MNNLANFRRRQPVLSNRVAAIPIPLLAPKHTRIHRRDVPAMLIPGNGVLESTTIGGTVTFFSIYQNVIVARILLSWFPGVQGSRLIRPIITVCDPYLNLFRSVVPPIFGLDLSPVLALFVLQALGSATAALGAEMNHRQPVHRPQGLLEQIRLRLPWHSRN